MFSKTLSRKGRNKEKVTPNKKERKTNITVESFVKQHQEIFKGLLTGENVIVFSDSDTDIEDRPPPQVIPVRMTQKQDKIKAKEMKEKADAERKRKRKVLSRKRSRLLLKKKRARLNKIATAGALLIDKNAEQVNETINVEPDTAVKVEVKQSISRSRELWKKMFFKTAIFRSQKNNVKLQPEAAGDSTAKTPTAVTTRRKILNRLLVKSTTFRLRKSNANSPAIDGTDTNESSKSAMEMSQRKETEGPDTKQSSEMALSNSKKKQKVKKTLAFTLHRGESKTDMRKPTETSAIGVEGETLGLANKNLGRSNDLDISNSVMTPSDKGRQRQKLVMKANAFRQSNKPNENNQSDQDPPSQRAVDILAVAESKNDLTEIQNGVSNNSHEQIKRKSDERIDRRNEESLSDAGATTEGKTLEEKDLRKPPEEKSSKIAENGERLPSNTDASAKSTAPSVNPVESSDKRTRPETDVSIEGKVLEEKDLRKPSEEKSSKIAENGKRLPSNTDASAKSTAPSANPVESNDKHTRPETDVSIEGKALEEKDPSKPSEEKSSKIAENGEQSNLSTMQKQPTRLQKIEKNILSSLKYFVVGFFLEILFVVLALLPLGNRDCCITAQKDIPFVKNITIVLGNTTSFISKSGTDTEIYCEKFKNPNEAFLAECDDGTARQKVFTDVSIGFGCSLLSLFLYICHIRRSLRRGHSLKETLPSFLVYAIFIVVPLPSLTFEIMHENTAGIGRDLQLVICGLLTWVWLSVLGKSSMKEWTKRAKVATSLYAFIFIIIPISITICSFAFVSYKDTIKEIVPLSVSSALFSILSIAMLSIMVRKKNATNSTITIHDKIMRYMVIGAWEFLVIIPLSMSTGLLTEGLYVSPGSVYFYTHPVLEVSAVMLAIGIIALFALSIVREKTFRREIPAKFRWAYFFVVFVILCLPIPYFSPFVIFAELQTNTNEAILFLVFAPSILIILWVVLVTQRFLHRLNKMQLAKAKNAELEAFFAQQQNTSKKENGQQTKKVEEQNITKNDSKTKKKKKKSKQKRKKLPRVPLDEKDRKRLRVYVLKTWAPSTFVYIVLFASFFPPYYAMINYRKFFMPTWEANPMEQIKAPAWFFFISVLGVGNLLCQLGLNTVWAKRSIVWKSLDTMVLHGGIIVPIGLFFVMLSERAHCKISTIVASRGKLNFTVSGDAFSTFDEYFLNSNIDLTRHCDAAMSLMTYIFITIGIGLLYALWSFAIAKNKVIKMSLVRKVPTILLYFTIVAPTLPVVLYDWGRHYVESIDPTAAFEFEVPPITDAVYCGRDYSKCPDQKGSGLLDKPISDLFVMCFLVGMGWFLIPLLSTCKCALKLTKYTQAACIFFVSVFSIPSASLLWHYRSQDLPRWNRWNDIGRDEWAWCTTPISDECEIMPNNATMSSSNIMVGLSSVHFLAESLLHCYVLGGVHMALFLALADRFKLHKNKVGFVMLLFVYTTFIVLPTTALPYLIPNGKQHEIGLVRMSSYFGVLVSIGFLVGATKWFRKLSMPRKIIFAAVYTICFAIPTCLGIYYLRLEVVLWSAEVNVAGSSFVGIFIFLFERYDAYKMKHVALLSRLLFFSIWMVFITAPMLSTALIAYENYESLLEIDLLQIPFYMTRMYALWIGVTLMYYLRMYTGYLQKFKQPILSLFPGLVLLVGEALFFVVLQQNYIHRTEGDELPIFEFSMIFIFPLYILFIFSFAELHIMLVDKFFIASVFFVLAPTFIHLEGFISFDDPGSNIATMYNYFVYAIPIGSMFCVFLPSLVCPGITLIDVSNIYLGLVVLPAGAFVPIVSVSNGSLSTLIVSGISASICLSLMFTFIALRKRRRALKQEGQVQRPSQGRPDGFEWLSWFPMVTMKWISHWMLLFSLLALMYVSKHVSTPARKNAVLTLTVASPLMYLIGNTRSLWKCFSHKISIAILCICIAAALVLSIVFQKDKSLSASLTSGAFVVSGMMISYGVLRLLNWCMKQHPRQQHVSSLASTLCCLGVFLPFGIFFPSLVSSDWDMTLQWGTIFIISISALIFVCLVDVSSVTIAINSTLNTIEYEKRAKAAIKRLQKLLREKHNNLQTQPDPLRSMYDQAMVASRQTGQSEWKAFKDSLVGSGILMRVQRKKTVKLIDAVKASSDIKSHKIRLCPSCEKNGWKTIVTTRNKFRVCTACNLKILLEEKEKIRRMKEASAEEREQMRKEKERLYKIEVEKKKKRNEKFMKAQEMVKKNELEEALSLYNELLDEDSFNAHYLCSRSVVYSKMKRHEEAYEDANEALSIRPKYINGYIAKATAQGSMKMWKNAVQTYAVGRTHFPKSKELYELQIVAVKEMKRTAPPLTLFQYLKRKIMRITRAIDSLEQQIEMSIAKFEEDIKSAGNSIQKKLNLSKHKLYGGQAFLVQLVELGGIDENLKYKSFVCDVKLSSHPNDRGYEEVRKDLPDVKERIKGYVRETRELNDLDKLFWRKELAFFPQSILKGHTVRITLYGVSEDGDGMEENDNANEAENVRTILGVLDLPSYYVAKLCRNNTYEPLSFKVPALQEISSVEDNKKTLAMRSQTKAARKYSKKN